MEITSTGKNLQAIAPAVLEAFNDRRLQLYEDPDLRRDLQRLRVEERTYGFRLTSPRDERGHGDLGTAFSLAMLAASERAARRRTVIQPMFGGDSQLSPYQRAMLEHEKNVAEYEHEQSTLLGQGTDDTSDWWRSAMRRVGRT
jgi:hypothetical protein